MCAGSRSRRLGPASPALLALLAVVAAAAPAAAVPAAAAPAAAALAPRYAFGAVVDYPLVFPVGGDDFYYADDEYLGFWACRDGCESIHHAIDIMADKMIEVYAVADATVTWVGSTCCSLGLAHDDGWASRYIHLNNDTPGTDDGLGWGIAAGITVGSRVAAGQLIGWVGDSGNAEATDPHLHFELHAPGGIEVDPYDSLQEGEAARGFACQGRPATRVDTNGDHSIVGTSFPDVIVGSAGDDSLDGGDGDDLICGGDGNDIILGGPGDDDLDGGMGRDDLSGGEGRDRLLGGPGNDRLRWDPGRDTLNGGGGRDVADYREAPLAVVVDLVEATAACDALDVLAAIEVVVGTPFADLLRGGPGDETLHGMAGRDRISGGAGDDALHGGPRGDTLFGGPGNDHLRGDGGRDRLSGGRGTDTCLGESTAACEA